MILLVVLVLLGELVFDGFVAHEEEACDLLVAGRFVGTDDPLGALAREALGKIEGR